MGRIFQLLPFHALRYQLFCVRRACEASASQDFLILKDEHSLMLILPSLIERAEHELCSCCVGMKKNMLNTTLRSSLVRILKSIVFRVRKEEKNMLNTTLRSRLVRILKSIVFRVRKEEKNMLNTTLRSRLVRIFESINFCI
jgi:hypothetical protein